jgi:hypothetical protein
MNLRDSELRGPPGGSAIRVSAWSKPCQPVINSAPGSLETNKFPCSDSQWLLPY